MDFLTDKGKLVFRNGDVVIANKTQADKMYAEKIIKSHKGNYFTAPILGVGIDDRLNGPFSPVDIKRLISVNLKADDFKIYGITVDDPDIVVNAERKKV